MNPIIFHSTFRIRDGRLDAFKDAVARAVAFVEENGPQLLVQTTVDDEAMKAHSIQVYPDSAAIRMHWSMSDPYIRAVNETVTPERLDILGEPDDDVLGELQPFASHGVVPTVTQHLAGFSRM